MALKTNIRLDSRLRSVGDIQTVCAYDDKFVGSKGYFFNGLVSAQNLKGLCDYGTLEMVDDNNLCDLCFKRRFELNECDGRSFYSFFIPESLLKPEEPQIKYRPYDWYNEFEMDTGKKIGDAITIRQRTGNPGPIRSMILAYSDTEVTLGYGGNYSMEELLKKFEFFSPTGWKPFGMKV